MAIIYTQKQRKDTGKWVTVSYSDEAEQPFYDEHGGHHDTEQQARDAWVNSEEHKRLFPAAHLPKPNNSHELLARIVRRIMNGQQVEPVEMADALKQYDEQKS